MNESNKSLSNRKSSVWIWLVVVALIAAGAVGLGMWPIDHIASGSSRREFAMEVDFDKFRQILVRKNATEAIVAHSGMKLLKEDVEDVAIDMPKQERPILNAILGKAKADLKAEKSITVSVDDPSIGVDKLDLNQIAEVEPNRIDVRTAASEPVGNLKSYSTRLLATKKGQATEVELAVDQTISVRVPRLFVTEADRRVQKAAEDSTAELEEAIRNFISKYENDEIVVPELR